MTRQHRAIYYELHRLDIDEPEGHPLRAGTDAGARRSAEAKAREMGCGDYSITFFRTSDACEGAVQS